MEQIELNLDIEKDEILEESEDIRDKGLFLYKARLRDLINNLGEFESYDGIQVTKDGQDRLQQVSKYIVTMLILEIIDELKKSGRKQIRPYEVDKALDKILVKASGIDMALDILKTDIEKLKSLNIDTVINKANEFINYGDK